MPEAVITHLRRRNVSLVVIDPGTPVPDLATVTMDNDGGARAAVRHLIELGHDRIAYVAGPLSRLSYRQRLEGYRSAHFEAGLPLDRALVVADDRPPFQQTLDLLQSTSPPTAMLAGNDGRAVQAMRAVAQLGRRVPEDVSVVGFDDLPLAEALNPPLTTVHAPKDEFGELAVRLLIEAATVKRPPEATSHVLPTWLVTRQSTAPPRREPA
jgi:LacI family transcriptional regulator